MDNILKVLTSCANPVRAKQLQRFFKTGVGEYGEGDKFLGIVVSIQRTIVKKFYSQITLNDVVDLLHNPYHECRLTALLILVAKYKKGVNMEKEKILKIYLQNTEYINNWDLVDLSARDIVGEYYFSKDKKLLYDLTISSSLWERRISVIATFYFIAKNQFDDSLKIAKMLLKDEHDLIHKAVGWMLREIGKRNQVVEEEFLKKYYKIMPKTMLRYAIERFDEKKRKFFMQK